MNNPRNLSTFCTPARELKVKAILSFAPAFLFLCWFLRNQLPGLPAAAWTSSLTEEPPHPEMKRWSRSRSPDALCEPWIQPYLISTSRLTCYTNHRFPFFGLSLSELCCCHLQR
ncbi:hypothetical protein VULLAG_LOCUS10099 [Vulpes lagopus]